jgi:dihydroneopterin aldolase
MGIIEIEDMEFFAHHGCYEEERTRGNVFRVDLRLEADIRKAAATDNIADTVNYQTVYRIVEREMQTPSNLLEHVCGRIISALCAEMSGIASVTVKVAKLHPRMGGIIGATSVSMTETLHHANHE